MLYVTSSTFFNANTGAQSGVFHFERAFAGCGVNRHICLDLEGSASHPKRALRLQLPPWWRSSPSPPLALHPFLSLHPSIKMSVWTLWEKIDDWQIRPLKNGSHGNFFFKSTFEHVLGETNHLSHACEALRVYLLIRNDMYIFHIHHIWSFPVLFFFGVTVAQSQSAEFEPATFSEITTNGGGGHGCVKTHVGQTGSCWSNPLSALESFNLPVAILWRSGRTEAQQRESITLTITTFPPHGSLSVVDCLSGHIIVFKMPVVNPTKRRLTSSAGCGRNAISDESIEARRERTGANVHHGREHGVKIH